METGAEAAAEGQIKYLIAGGVVKKFAFYNTQMTILTDDEIHLIDVETGYNEVASLTFTPDSITYTFKTLTIDTHIGIKTSITLGDEITSWMTNLN